MTKKDKPTKKYIFLKILGALAAVFFILSAVSFPLRTVCYTLVSRKVTKKVRIVQISDLHSCSYGKNMKNLINAVDAAEPDIIVLTGDIFDNRTDNKNSDTLLKAIAKKYPCYYVSHIFPLYSWGICGKLSAGVRRASALPCFRAKMLILTAL